MINYLPFVRRQRVIVPLSVNGRPGRAATRFTHMRVGGGLKVHLEDAFIFQADGFSMATGSNNLVSDAYVVRMRVGVDGRGFLTENLYDYRIYIDGDHSAPVWNWSGKSRSRPYRLRKGEQMRVRITWSDASGVFPTDQIKVPAVMFNCIKEATGEPWLLYGSDPQLITVPANIGGVPIPAGTGNMLWDVMLDCTRDSDLLLYSVTIPEFQFLTAPLVQIWDGKNRPMWNNSDWTRIIDPFVSSIMLSEGEGSEWDLDMDETVVFEFENDYAALPFGAPHMDLDVTIRGTLEVDE